MTLMRCPDCGRQMSDAAASCPSCGRPQAGRPGAAMAVPTYRGFEYRSERTLFGWPLVHAVYGPAGGIGLKPARGIFAFGNVAIGVVAFGGVAIGAVALGGIALGLVSLAGIALGLIFGLGGIATGYWALGGIAIGATAIGGVALGTHTLQNDPELARTLRSALFGPQ